MNEKMPLRFEIFLAVGITIIGFSAFGLTWSIMSYLGTSLKGGSLFAGYRTLLLILVGTAVVPTAMLAEFLNKEWKRRRFLWKSALMGVGVSGIYVAVTIPLLTACDVFLSELALIWQFPFAAATSSLGLIALALVMKNERFRKYARENLGW